MSEVVLAARFCARVFLTDTFKQRVIARSESDEAIQNFAAGLDCFAIARNDEASSFRLASGK
jgi:hypothetical protein